MLFWTFSYILILGEYTNFTMISIMNIVLLICAMNRVLNNIPIVDDTAGIHVYLFQFRVLIPTRCHYIQK